MRKQSQKPVLMNLRRVTDFASAFFAFSTSCSMLGRACEEQNLIRMEVQQSLGSTKEKKSLVYPYNNKLFFVAQLLDTGFACKLSNFASRSDHWLDLQLSTGVHTSTPLLSINVQLHGCLQPVRFLSTFRFL